MHDEPQRVGQPLTGRCGIITGAAGGLGHELSKKFVAAGARVALLDLEESEARACAELVGGGSIGLGADITDEQQVSRAFERVASEFGALDFLVNNAGVRYETPFLTHDIDDWRRTLEVNLTGTFLCARAAARLMVERGRGKILNISSIAASSAFTRRPAYIASKAGVLGLTRAIAWELGPMGIHCNAIAPGIVRTPLTAHYFENDELATAICSATALRRWAEPHDIAGPAVFLCSSASDFIQGATLIADGGWLAGKGY